MSAQGACPICAADLHSHEIVLRAGTVLTHAHHWRGPERRRAAVQGRLYRLGKGPRRLPGEEPLSLSAALDAIAVEALALGDVAVLDLVAEADDRLQECATVLGETVAGAVGGTR